MDRTTNPEIVRAAVMPSPRTQPNIEQLVQAQAEPRVEAAVSRAERTLSRGIQSGRP